MTRTQPIAPALLLCAALAATAGCHGNPAVAAPAPAEKPNPAILTVSGTATLDVAPDVADVAMTLTVENRRPNGAVAALRQQQSALVARLTAAGIENADIAVSHLSLNPVYDYQPAHRLRGYQAQLTVTASTRDFDRIGDLMEAGAEAGVTHMSTGFRSTRIQELKKQVRDMALAAARDKAEQMAGAVGVTLARVTQLAETPAGHGWYWDQGYANAVGTADRAGLEATLEPTRQPLTLTVSIGYEIEG
jgi:uncharacterized protein